MAEVGSTVKGMWGPSVIGEALSLDPITIDKWGSFILDDKILVSMRRIGEDQWDEFDVEVYAFERALVVCRAASPSSAEGAQDSEVYPVLPWAPGPAMMDPRRDLGEGSILCLIPLDFEGPRRVYSQFFSDQEGGMVLFNF